MAKKKKKALGRGLDALFPEVNRAVHEESDQLISIPVDKIDSNPFQPRKEFDEEKLSELADSIRKRGLLQPLLVRKKGERFQLVAGERRLRASSLAELASIPALLVQADDEQTLEMALIENLQRENLNPMEESRGYEELQENFGLTQEEIAEHVGKNRSTVANSLRLLKLDPTIREDLEAGRLSPGHARALLSLNDKKLQRKLWSLIVEKNLSVRQTEILAREMKEKKPAKKQDNIQTKSPDIVELEEKLISLLGTRVMVRPSSRTAGRIVIHYSTLEDIDRILEVVGAPES